MKKYRSLLAIAAAVALTIPVFAGEGKCGEDTQTCLNMMAAHMKDSPYIGIDLEYEESGSATVTSVTDHSPAQAAGFKTGDRIVALNGIDFSDKEAMHAEWKTLAPGKQATIKVERNGAVRKLNVTLAAMPDDVIAQKVGMHMLDHAIVDVAQN